MHLALRPYVTSGVALVGAAVIVASPITVTPVPMSDALSPVDSSMAVESASLITDLLDDIGIAATVGGDVSEVLLKAAGSLPLQLAVFTQAAADNPELIPNLASLLAYGFLNPPTNSIPIPSVLGNLELALLQLGPLLPTPLQLVVSDLLVAVNGLVIDGLDVLPNPLLALPAVAAAAGNLPTDLVILLNAVQTSVAGGPVQIPPIPTSIPSPGVAGWVGAAPLLALASLQVAVNDPSAIPGLLSYLAYSIASPPSAAFPPIGPGSSLSLFSAAVLPYVAALGLVLPPQLANAVGEAATLLSDVLTETLGVLPTPINPFMTMLNSQQLQADPGMVDGEIAAPRTIEDVVNRLTYSGAEGAVALTGLTSPLIGAVFGFDEQQAPLATAQLTLGLLGPVISGPGAAGTAAQDLVDALRSGDPARVVDKLIGAPGTVIDGIVNGGYGPDLGPLIPTITRPAEEAARIERRAILAGGLLNPVRQPAREETARVVPGAQVLPGTIPTLQAAATRLLNREKAPVEVKKLAADDDTATQLDAPSVTPKKQRPLLQLNVHRSSPLGQAKGADETAQAGDDGGSKSVKPARSHRPGDGRLSVRDIVKRLTGADRDKEKADNGSADSSAPAS